MSVEDVRVTIADVLRALNATDQIKPSRLAAFEDGEEDIRLVELAFGSLARMELLVALELEHGATITPQELSELKSLDDIVQRVSDGPDSGGAPLSPDAAPARQSSASASDDPKPPIVSNLERELSECRGIVHLHKLLSDLMHRVTPLDVVTLNRWHQRGSIVPSAAPPDFGTALSKWLGDILGTMDASGKPEPEPFTFTRVVPAVVHFSAPGDRASKTLVVCFSTVGGRQMWMPNPVLLQHTDATQFDLLVISDAERTGFRRGVPGMGGSVADVVQWVAELELLREYGALRTFGCSAGAYPAMLAALRLNAELGVSVAGRFPRPHLGNLGQIARTYVNTWVAARHRTRARVLMVHGTGLRDTRFARRLGWIAGANRLCVEMSGQPIKHNVIKPFIERGELRQFLDRTVFARVEAELLATTGARARLMIPGEQVSAPLELTLET